MFWDGVKFAFFVMIVLFLAFGELKIGRFNVTDNKPLKWSLIIFYSFGAGILILKYLED
ncbi:hypothetical protein ACWOAH_10410 [Vagococcus vulneris]|uniref:hypothetical protein n=1 Tax=Vagococcus vulneris TaxID=1977869 RepID=UPI00140417B7|nr:hypothetical protein [Vagococcus vulneris]